MSISADNRRIAKNTLALYMRMAVMMVVSLFTSRVVLQTLGVDDFGIYNVVGGVVVLFSFLNAAMSSATQRFLNFELGRNDIVQAGRVFSMSVNVHFVIAGTVFVLAETVGLWFLNTQLNIPAARMEAANWVYQFSVFSTLLGIMLVPYNATIIAHERMGFYAWASVGNAVLRLLIVYMLYIGDFDKLILYAILTFAVGVIMQIVNVAYCKKVFPQVAIYRPFWERQMFKEIFAFSGWNLFGGIASIGNTQGLNMILNIFCGVVVNAAMGIANQVSGAVYQFVSNFQTAFNPQIVKKFAAGEDEATRLLVARASKISFALVLFLAAPIIANTELILSTWLGIVPEHAVTFVQLTLIYCLTDTLSSPLFTLVSASGKIRAYQIIIGLMFLANVPLAFLLLWLGFAPEWVIISRIFITFLMIPVRIWTCKKNAKLHARRYIFDVLLKTALLFLFVVPAAYFVAHIFSQVLGFFISGTLSVFLTLAGAWIFCFDKNERRRLLGLVRNKISKFQRKLIVFVVVIFILCFVIGGCYAVEKTFPQECQSKNKTVHVSIDDVFISLKALSNPNVKSIYDVEFFQTLKEWNEKYDAKFTLYVFGEEKDGFALNDVPANFKAEFLSAASWLKFGFHASYTSIAFTKSQSLQEFKNNFENAQIQIERFAGTQLLTSTLRLDYFFAKSEWETILFSSGIEFLLGPDSNNRLAYSLSMQDSQKLFQNGILKANFDDSARSGGGYMRTDLRFEKMAFPWWELSKIRDRERLVVFTHEWALNFKTKFIIEQSLQYFKNHNYSFIY